jgi:hypothetical protein
MKESDLSAVACKLTSTGEHAMARVVRSIKVASILEFLYLRESSAPSAQ